MLLIAGRGFGQGFWKNLGAAPGANIGRLVQVPDGTLYLQNAYENYYNDQYSGSAYLVESAVWSSKDTGKTWDLILTNLPATQGNQTFFIGRSGTFFFSQSNYVSASWPPLYNYTTWQSPDEGLNWFIVQDSSNISGIKESGDGTFWGLRSSDPLLSDLEVVKSTDLGQNWQVAHSPVNHGNWSFIFDIDDFGNIKAGLDVSADGGQTWKTIIPADDYMMLDNGKYLACYLYLNSQGVIVRGTAGAADTVEIKIDPNYSGPLFPKKFFRLDNGRILLQTQNAVIGQSRIYFSDDDGFTWATDGQFDFPGFVHKKPLSDGSIFANNFTRSVDTMQSWKYAAGDLLLSSFIKTKPDRDSGHVFGLNSHGFWKTKDDGISWELLFDGLSTGRFPLFYDFEFDNAGNPFILTDSAIYYSTTGNSIFENIAPAGFFSPDKLSVSGNFPPLIFFDSVGQNLFVRGQDSIYRSGDFGNNWSAIPGMGKLTMRDLYVTPGGKLFGIFTDYEAFPYSYPYSSLFTSINGGQNWQLETVPSGSFNEITADLNGKIYMSKRDYWDPLQFATSVDTGSTWEMHESSVVLGYPVFDSENTLYASDTSKVYRSFDGGETWFNLPVISNNGYRPVSNLSLDNNDILYLSNFNSSVYRTSESVLNGAFLTGTLYKSNDSFCQTPDPQVTLPNWIVTATGLDKYYASTADDGKFQFYLEEGPFLLVPHPHIGPLWGDCPDSTTVYIPSFDTTIIRDLQETALADCPYMTVDAWAWLQRCFNSYMYFNYCNVGTLPTDSAWLEIELDPYLTLTDSVHNWLPLGQNRFKTFLGALDIGECGSLTAQVFTDCDSTVLGQVHCIEAHVTPDNLCIIDSLWSGAEIMARAICAGDSVRFEVGNPTNVATQPLEYVIIEDDVILFESNATYPANSVTNFTVEAGGFLRFESEQEPNHPFSTMVAAWQAGCDTMGGWTWINQFFTDNGFPSRDVACVANVGSYDPNDKLATPLGFGAEHFILPETDLEYVVNFQNTGTAAAQNVVIRDTISGFLDPATIRIGASSHPMKWSIDGHGTLKVSFENINLPDSNANEAASHGFFSFKISQKPGLPLGTLIENRAAIYFDFNEPIITNTTFHRLQLDFLKTKDVAPAPGSRPSVKIRPNPITDYSLLEFENLPLGQRQFTLTNTLGATMQSEFFSGQKFHFERRELPAGAYFFSVSTEKDGRVLGGKMILR